MKSIKVVNQIINEERSFLSSLPLVNTLLSLMIVIHHGFTRSVTFIGSYYVADYGKVTAIERYLYNLSECAVPVFYFLSAYLFYRTYDGTKEMYYAKMKRRFWSLLVPYLVFNTIGYAKAMVFSGRNGGGNGLSSLNMEFRYNAFMVY